MTTLPDLLYVGWFAVAGSVIDFLIADIDSPRIGVIHVAPRELDAVAESMRPP